MKTSQYPLVLAAVLAVSAAGSSAQEWTRFHGPNGTGISHAKTIPTKIGDADVNWKVELPGVGHSSPVLWGEKIFVTTTGDKAGGFSVVCLNARDGKQLWKKDYPLEAFRRHNFNHFASSTPAVDAERVYVSWNQPDHFYLAALDHTGNEKWKRDLGPFVSQHACGISPIVHNGRVILGNEQDDIKADKAHARSGESFITALDAKSGSTVWQTPRKSVVVAYSTPCVYTPKGGKPALIFNSQGHGIYAVNPDNGRVLWEFEKAFTMRSVSSPLIAGDIIYGSCGSGAGGNYVTAVRAGDAAAKRAPELAYTMKAPAPYVPTGIVVGDLVWLWSDSGFLTCLHAPTGQVRFQERASTDIFGSPVWVDGRLFCVTRTGDLVVVEAGDKFNPLHTYKLGELCHSTPAVALGRMFIRTEKRLWSLGGAKPAAK
ncbi:MAG: hypothetical protein FJ386_15455 [Verrucomicrobia bacterium]|nr:hypothetical protein [Verrucomicrobiota bacterium]